MKVQAARSFHRDNHPNGPAELAGWLRPGFDDDWSPQQIAQWLRREHPGYPGMWVSHESIYCDVYAVTKRPRRQHVSPYAL